MPWVGFEHTITVSERAKAVHALDRLATVTGVLCIYIFLIDVDVYLLVIQNYYCKASYTKDTRHAIRHSKLLNALI
jgi:hypothetical protein